MMIYTGYNGMFTLLTSESNEKTQNIKVNIKIAISHAICVTIVI